MTMTITIKKNYLKTSLHIQWIVNIACKVPNTVKIVLMQFFTTIMEIEFVAMSINMVQNQIIYVGSRRSHQGR